MSNTCSNAEPTQTPGTTTQDMHIGSRNSQSGCTSRSSFLVDLVQPGKTVRLAGKIRNVHLRQGYMAGGRGVFARGMNERQINWGLATRVFTRKC